MKKQIGTREAQQKASVQLGITFKGDRNKSYLSQREVSQIVAAMTEQCVVLCLEIK